MHNARCTMQNAECRMRRKTQNSQLITDNQAHHPEVTDMPTVTRILNFSSGPAVLPVPVLEQVQRDLLALPGVGMSVMEISHRSSTFEGILHKAESDIRTLANVPPNYKILFLQGGGTLQF